MGMKTREQIKDGLDKCTFLVTKLGEARHNKMIRKPMAWAFYETWKVVNEKEKEQAGTARTDNADRMG